MASNLYQQLNQNQSQMPNNFQQMSNTLNGKQILQEYRQSGMPAKDFFFKKAGEMGIDPLSILSKM